MKKTSWTDLNSGRKYTTCYRLRDYYEAPSAPQVSEEPTPADHVQGNYPQWGDEQYMDWCRGCPVDASLSSYCYDDGDPYDYDELGLADRLFNVVHAADQPLWDGCTQSELGVIAELVVMKDAVDLEYCKFCGDPRYKPSRGRDPHRKKSPYVVLRYLQLTPRLQRLYSLRATAKHMSWHATHQTEEGSMCHPSDAESWKHFDWMYPDFIEESRNVRLGLCIDGFALHELLKFWHVGSRTYDHATNMAFMMLAVLMWTENDLPT
ncbi:hypothetical protein Sango_0721800 [Sesamum angolense]|uniref:Uncharacterized protein n=1 Tax=Sesamum angolense TaxID=2727404 RepID=A0AAE2BZJ3_9LAMI|nr:hypothetical protein Sango_0721800 [Sesamum angolense]